MLSSAGELVNSAGSSTALFPVTIGTPSERVEPGTEQRPAMFGFRFYPYRVSRSSDRAMISVESGADPALLRSILESLRK